ncbi:MAG: 3-hydroxyacyl-CoA dehydrogenase family protein, partial [bacterium]|nr:3-hydroxyacyl-CoA dehydrogenase family protein [bacterium]
IGAAGKMGSGIALLLAQEMAMLKLKPENKGKKFRLNLIDMNDDALDGLVQYLKSQALKTAEKSTVMLRDFYADRSNLVENYEIIGQFIDDLMAMVRVGTDLSLAAKSHLVFEAIIENIDVKLRIFNQLKEMCASDTLFFSNTSSVPIHLVDDGANLGGRIIGFHFYNPPPVQRLAELIPAKETKKELIDLSYEIAKRLKKTIFLSADVAGFIGNGHFLRDGLHAISEVERLQKDFKPFEAIYIVNKVSQDLLLRPMGIFQLMDYVGVDVMYFISKIMDKYIPDEKLDHEFLDDLFARKILGGQRADGSQKDGMLKYENNRPVGVFCPREGKYKMFEEAGWTGEVNKKIGIYPDGWQPWKGLLKAKDQQDKIRQHFEQLKAMKTLGAELAIKYLKRSKEIGQYLVDSGIAQKAEDVNGVLMNGFYHLYGPINDYV